MTAKEQNDAWSPEETARVSDAALKRLLATPPDHKTKARPFGAPLPRRKLNTFQLRLIYSLLDGQSEANGLVTDPVTALTTGQDQEWLGGTYADPFSKSRSITGLFAEFRIPLTGTGWNVPGFRALDLIGAARWENYSDAGSSTVPKIGFRWQPFDRQLTVRGNYSKSFSAPPLFAEYGPTDTRQVGAGVIQGVFGPNYTGMPINGEDGNNPNLKPAKSTSKTLGFVFKPDFAKGLSLAADYSYIELYGLDDGLGFTTILSSIEVL